MRSSRQRCGIAGSWLLWFEGIVFFEVLSELKSSDYL